jgi:hypothetical protein
MYYCPLDWTLLSAVMNPRVSQAVRRFFSQSASQSVSQPARHPANQPASQPANQSVSQSVNQPAKQPVSQWVSQSACLPAILHKCFRTNFRLGNIYSGFWQRNVRQNVNKKNINCSLCGESKERNICVLSLLSERRCKFVQQLHIQLWCESYRGKCKSIWTLMLLHIENYVSILAEVFLG